MSLLRRARLSMPRNLQQHSAAIACITASASLLSLPVFAAAQPANTSGEFRTDVVAEIIVTARKQAERLQETPVPVAAVSGESLVTSNQVRIEDFYRTVPGLAFAPQGSGGEPTIAVRGVTTGGTSNPTVGVVIDEVSYGPSVATGPNAVSIADIDPNDLERVEVLRGPQGTLYGVSSIGGLLKFVTVDPSTEEMSGRLQVGSASVSHGDDLGHSVRANLNLPLGDTLAMRVSGFSLRDPGYIDNAETGQRDVNNRDSDGGRLSALWRPSDNFSVKLSALVQESERNGTGEADITFGKEDFRQGFLRGTGNYLRESEAYSATIVGNLGPVELTSATGYSKDHSLAIVDNSAVLGFLANLFFGVDRAATVIDRDVEKFSQELRASIPLGERVNWLVGAFYTDEDIELFADNRAANSDGQFVGSMYNNAYGVDDPRGPATYEEKAAFTTLTVDLTDRWDVQLGGRYSDNSQTTPTHWSGPLAVFVFGSDPFFNEAPESTDSAFTYLVTPRFRVSQNLMLYARFASGYRPGGINVACGHPEVPCTYQDDRTENYDLGAKGSLFGGALSFDAALYYVDWTDIQIADLLTSDGFPFTENVSKAKSKGAELTLTAQPTPDLSISAWGAYTDAELTAPLASTASLINGRAGDRLPYSSRVSGSIAAEWELPVTSVANVTLGAAVSYVGSRNGRFQQGVTARETYPSYTQVDLHAALTFGTWQLNAFINNATDELAILRSGVDNFGTPNYVTYIQPRTIGVSLSKTF
jgi:iron complex outermembrane recepter protein